MSFQIEYTGSLVDNRDVSQVTTSSSLNTLSLSGNVLDSTYEFNTPTFPTGSSFEGSFSNGITFGSGETRLYSDTGVGSGQLLLTGSKGVFANAYSMRIGSNVVPSGTIRVEIRTGGSVVGVSGSQFFYNESFSNSTPFLNTAFSLFDFTYVSNGGGIILDGLGGAMGIDYIRIFQETNLVVNITPSTLTSGVQKTGGTAITPTITTVQDGAVAITGPANNFGLVAKDGTPIKNSALFYPAALDSEESEATISNVKVIQAGTTAISVEGIGLGGTEKLKSGSSIIVEDVDHMGSN